MDAKDIRNLSEAYLEVYASQEELDEAEKWIQKAIKKPGALSKQLGVPEKENIPAKKLAAAAKKGGKLGRRARLAQTLKSLHKEEVDLYDIILSHLLDEGYAETIEDAEVMMVNMSEEWRDSIVEAEGSYGQTPKAHAAFASLAAKRQKKPASQYPQRGAKTKAVASAEKHTERSKPTPAHRGRGPMDDESREYSREKSEVYGGGRVSDKGGSITKNPKKLRKQKAMGELGEATAMSKRGHDEASIRQRIAKSTGGGEAADRAKALADRQTYGDEKTAKARQRLARIQVGDFRKTTSSSPGLHGYAHKSDDPEVKAKQAARGAQRGALTPREKKQLGR